MAEYLLPCKCGDKTKVSTAQAGDTIRCSCGAELQVPSLRGLRSLEPADNSAFRNRAWNDQHRVAFLLVLAASGCMAIAGYLWATLPTVARQPTTEEFRDAVDEVPPAELFDVHRNMMQGLRGASSLTAPEAKSRQMMLWGIGIVSVLAVALLASAWIIVFNRPSKQRRPNFATSSQERTR